MCVGGVADVIVTLRVLPPLQNLRKMLSGVICSMVNIALNLEWH